MDGYMEKYPKKEFIDVRLQQEHAHTFYYVCIYICLIAPDPVLLQKSCCEIGADAEIEGPVWEDRELVRRLRCRHPTPFPLSVILS
jgi:hypothetical protein